MRLLPAILLSTAIFASAEVPTPESVLGHKPGDDFYLATYDESLQYFQKLAASTDKLKLARVGKTTRGLDWDVAYISSAKNLAELDKYKETAKKLALVKGLSDADARALARTGKAIVHIDGGRRCTAHHSARLQSGDQDRPRDYRNSRQRDLSPVVFDQPRRPKSGGD